jgi:hypothetical protein
MSRRTAPLLVAAAAIAIYSGALTAGFVGDDFMILHRLREAGGLAGAGRFFRGEFFEYYRPLGFVAHALDWTIAGANARQFHLTNLVLHAINSVLVLLIGRALAPRTIAGPLAGVLFALHASNHEAVVWISARFDLLATCFALLAIWWLVRNGRGSWLGPALLFLGATLSKEAAVALPLAAAGFAVFHLRAGTAEAVRRVLPWIAALAIHAAARQLAGGVSPIGGASRLPKLASFLILLGVVLALSGERWLAIRTWLRGHRGAAVATLLLIAAAVAATAAAGGRAGRLMAEKLAVAGFALFHLASPWLDTSGVPFYLQPGTPQYWLGGFVASCAAIGLLALAWRAIVDDDRLWFLGCFLLAALLPISALTEGARYLYLPSAALSLAAGVLTGELRAHQRRVALAVVTLFLAVSAVQIVVKVRDWRWAGRMTADAAAMVDASLTPTCGSGQVVFLTEPVAIRAVYTHFLYETFALPRGCMPGVFQNLVRVQRLDADVEARWDGPSRIVITAAGYRGNFSLSPDLRVFDPPLPRGGAATLETPLGELRAEPAGAAERLTLTIAPGLDVSRVHWFYYSRGAMRPLAK